jgi:hypothetical protein
VFAAPAGASQPPRDWDIKRHAVMQHSRGTQLDERRTREEEHGRAHLAQM